MQLPEAAARESLRFIGRATLAVALAVCAVQLSRSTPGARPGRRVGHSALASPQLQPASWQAVVRLAHQRWAIEQQYAELKSELGFDDFVGRSFPGWNRHVVLTAVAYAFLQVERRRHGPSRLTFPRARAVMTDVLTAYYFVTAGRTWRTKRSMRSTSTRARFWP